MATPMGFELRCNILVKDYYFSRALLSFNTETVGRSRMYLAIEL